MKRLLLGVFIFLVGATFAQDKRLSFSNGYVNSGKFKVTKSVTEGDSYIDVTYNFTGAYMYNQVENGKTYTRIEMPDARVLNVKGEPALPYYKDLLAITSDKNVSVSVVKSDYKEYSTSAVLPATGPIAENKTPDPVVESNVYKSNTLFPTQIAKIEEVNVYRSIPYATVTLSPIRFNPITKKLRCYTSVTYRLKYNTVDVSNSLKASKESLVPLKNILSNPNSLDKFGNTQTNLRASESDNYNYIVVATNRDIEAVKKFTEWKTLLGYRCTTLVKSKWNSCDEVKTALTSIYNKQKNSIPEYLLIVGDHEDIPAQKIVETISSDTKYIYYSDNTFACVDNDCIEDVKKGRLSVSSAAEAMTVVNKIINYEKNPPTTSSFYNKVLDLAYFQDDQEWDNGRLIKDYDGQADRDFIDFAEEIKTSLIQKKFDVERFYVCKRNVNQKGQVVLPQRYCNGTSLPAEMLGENSIFKKDTDTDYINAINQGLLFAVYRGHGWADGYASVGFNTNRISNINNGNKLPVFLGFTCSAGTFAEVKGFSEVMMRKSNGGAVAMFGCTETSYGDDNNTTTKSILNAIFNQKIRNLGDALHESMISNFGATDVYHKHAHRITHYFGDPSMKMWTDVPTCINASITKEGTNIRVKTNGITGCKVTFCRISDMTIIDTDKKIMSSQEEVFDTKTNEPCYVTITKDNYIPYVGVARDLYLQNMSFNEDRTIHGVNITAGKNVTSDLTRGNVYVKKGKTTLLATSSLKLKSGFIVRNGAKFLGKKQARSCSYSGNGPRSLRSADIDLEYDDEEYVIDPEITDLDDAVSANGIEIYPNPTDGLLYIRSNNTINKVIVTDMTGKVILDEIGGSNEVEIDLSSNVQGMYLLNVVTDNDFYVEKVVLK